MTIARARGAQRGIELGGELDAEREIELAADRDDRDVAEHGRCRLTCLPRARSQATPDDDRLAVSHRAWGPVWVVTRGER